MRPVAPHDKPLENRLSRRRHRGQAMTKAGRRLILEGEPCADCGEVRMNQGGEPAHDDFELPPVDVKIPDDARELDRDVQAYYRELRAVRRQERSLRLRAPLRRTGVILPVAVGCLILALVCGMALTVFSANPYFAGAGRAKPHPGAGGQTAALSSGHRESSAAPSTTAAAPSAAQRSASASPPGGTRAHASPSKTPPTRLPAKTISVAGEPLALRGLTTAALAIVPAGCACTAAVQQLLAQARAARIPVYLVGPAGNRATLARLAAISGQTAAVATDARNVLKSAFQPVGFTVLLVDSNGRVQVATKLRPGLNLESRLQRLHLPG
jgi:hypothetical protein